MATRKPSAKVTRGHSGHEITFVCFQSCALPAALGRTVALPVAKAPSIAEAGTSTVAEAIAITHPLASEEAFIFNKGHANAAGGLIAQADSHTEEFADPKELTDTEDTQTCSIGKA